FAREPPGRPAEVWLAHDEPADCTLAKRAFAGALLRFSAPCDAIVFDAALVDRHVPKPDRKLHELLRRLAEERVSELPIPGPTHPPARTAPARRPRPRAPPRAGRTPPPPPPSRAPPGCAGWSRKAPASGPPPPPCAPAPPAATSPSIGSG